MSAKKQGCENCLLSRWWLTPTGKIKKGEAGRCVATFIPPTLPACITQPHYHRHYVHPGYGADCPLYEANDGKPITETNDREERRP